MFWKLIIQEKVQFNRASMMVFGLWLSYSLFTLPTIHAQNAPQQAPPLNCNDPKSKNEEYQCFMKRYETTQKDARLRAQAKKKKKNNRQQRDSAEDRRLKKEREEAVADMQKAIKKAKARNKSNKGKAYKITYGRVVEPRK